MNAIDLFAGAGGWSHGWRLATGVEPMVAVNHCDHAIRLHTLNHPATEHHTRDVWSLPPDAAIRGRRVDWLHGSPDCTHFSRAKGGKPRNQNIRALAGVIPKWAKVARPRIISLENVVEFLGWGPLDEHGFPIKDRIGETFHEFILELAALGYRSEWRVLCAADFGAPTIRKRLFLVARNDGKPIRWPEPTHADPKILYGTSSENAAERHRDQGPTRRRKAACGPEDGNGLRDGVEDSQQADRVTEQSRVSPDLHHNARQGSLFDDASSRLDCGARRASSRSADQSQGRQEGQQRAEQSGACHAGSEQRARQIDGPVEACGGYRERLREADQRAGAEGALHEGIRSLHGSDRGAPGDQRGLHAETHQRNGAKLQPWLTAASCIDWSIPCPSIFERKRPLAPATCRRIAAGIVRFVLQGRPFLVQTGYGERAGQAPRVLDLEQPLGTVVAGGALVAAFLQQNFTGMVGKPLRVPVPTITARDHHSLVAANLTTIDHQGNATGGNTAADGPVSTITTKSRHALVATFLTQYYGSGGQHSRVDAPMPAVVTRARHGLVTVTIDGVDYAIADIGLRMLEPRELARAQGFPDSYVLGGTKAQQIARIGNSVVPQVAAALVSANLGP